MKRNRLLGFVVVFIGSSVLCEVTKPVISQSPMDQDQISIYRIFLRSYNNGSTARLNLSKLTSTFTKTDAACLQGIELDPTGSYNSAIHMFDSHTTFPGNVHLVDPEEQEKAIQQNDPGQSIRQGKDVNGAVEAGFSVGLLTLSEVAFDRNHRYAAMSFSFVCGGLCGHGSTAVFEKKNGKWQQLKRRCGGWVS